MGGAFSKASNDVLLVGLKGAGKTYMLYNAINDEGWQAFYARENAKRQHQFNLQSKYIAIEPTNGFNNE